MKKIKPPKGGNFPVRNKRFRNGFQRGTFDFRPIRTHQTADILVDLGAIRFTENEFSSLIVGVPEILQFAFTIIANSKSITRRKSHVS